MSTDARPHRPRRRRDQGGHPMTTLLARVAIALLTYNPRRYW